jgi:hypothetical protein
MAADANGQDAEHPNSGRRTPSVRASTWIRSRLRDTVEPLARSRTTRRRLRMGRSHARWCSGTRPRPDTERPAADPPKAIPPFEPGKRLRQIRRRNRAGEDGDRLTISIGPASSLSASTRRLAPDARTPDRWLANPARLCPHRPASSPLHGSPDALAVALGDRPCSALRRKLTLSLAPGRPATCDRGPARGGSARCP